CRSPKTEPAHPLKRAYSLRRARREFSSSQTREQQGGRSFPLRGEVRTAGFHGLVLANSDTLFPPGGHGGRMSGITRRQMIGGVSGAALGLPFWPGSEDGEPRKAKVIVAGAHPDDPESGCGGTAALYSDLGCEVVLLYLTRGEAGIPGKSGQEAAAIRTAECQKA